MKRSMKRVRHWDPIFGELNDDEEDDFMVGAEVNPTKYQLGDILHIKGTELSGKVVAIEQKPIGKWLYHLEYLPGQFLPEYERYLRRIRKSGNPLTKVHPLAIEARKRYRGDIRAGHRGAAEYWRGQAGAYFTGNPTHYLKTLAKQYGGRYTRKRTPDGYILHTTTFPTGTLAKLKRQNPIMETLGTYFIAGLGLGAGFKTIEWGVNKIRGKNPTKRIKSRKGRQDIKWRKIDGN